MEGGPNGPPSIVRTMLMPIIKKEDRDPTSREFYIYTSWHHDTGYPVCFYVGKGSKSRVSSERGRSVFWWRVANKHGYTNVVVKSELTETEAFELERSLIKSIGRRDLGMGTLVNMTDGGEGASGHVLSDETKAKMSATTTGRKLSEDHCQRISDGRKGMKFSVAHKKKLSEARMGKTSPRKGKKGKPLTDEQRANLSAKLKGVVRSPETRAKMSAAKKGVPSKLKGKPRSPEAVAAAAEGRRRAREARGSGQ